MSAQINFLLHQAAQYINAQNLDGAELLLRQILKNKPNYSEASRLLGVVAAKKNNHELALELIESALIADKSNGIAYSNKGNILLSLDRVNEAIEAYRRAIKLAPNYAEAYSNLGNALQISRLYEEAIEVYGQAIKIDPNNSEFMVNLGNAYLRTHLYDEASAAYRMAIGQNPINAKAHFYMSLAQLHLKNFAIGWLEYEWRWLSKEIDSFPIDSTKPAWQGQAFSGTLLIWAEQGLGDQILYASILNDLKSLPQKIIITTNKKLSPIFKRSFPSYQIIDKEENVSENQYDYHIPIGNLGKFFRRQVIDFPDCSSSYLVPNKDLTYLSRLNELKKGKVLCGLSWKSSNKSVGGAKSMALMELSEILKLQNFEFLNLQYGDTVDEIIQIRDALEIAVNNINEVNLYDDLDHVLSLICDCDIIVTTSNSTAHMAGAAGKEVLLLLPFSVGAIWYWHDHDRASIWYPSIRIFRQEKQGDWSKPIQAVKVYLESRFGA